MKKALALTALLASGMAASSSAQVSATVGPHIAPTGRPILVSISNDTASTVYSKPCPFRVYDLATGATVWDPFCMTMIVPIDPGHTQVVQWDQVDDYFWAQVAPGQYRVEVDLADTKQVQDFVVTVSSSGAFPTMAPLGAHKIGTARGFQLDAPNHPGDLYVMAASSTAMTGIPTCGGTFPLDNDWLFHFSRTTPSIFLNFTGTLDANGQSQAPLFYIPNDVSLVGYQLYMAYAVVDPTMACSVVDISAAQQVTIL